MKYQPNRHRIYDTPCKLFIELFDMKLIVYARVLREKQSLKRVISLRLTTILAGFRYANGVWLFMRSYARQILEHIANRQG
jgi:hypothetical protein